MNRPYLSKSIALLGVLLLSACQTSSPEPEREAEKPSQSKVSQQLQQFQMVTGTPYLVAAIVEGGSRSSSLSGSYDASSGSTRNLVFLDSSSLASHRLFDENQFTILDSQQYPLQRPEQPGEAPPETRWFTYRVLTEDTNDNGVLDHTDHQSLGISSAAGKNYAEVLTGITGWFGTTEVQTGQILVIYEKEDEKIASLIDLEQRTVIKSEPLTALGNEVK